MSLTTICALVASELVISPKIVDTESLAIFAGKDTPLHFMKNVLKKKHLKHYHKRTVLPLFHAV